MCEYQPMPYGKNPAPLCLTNGVDRDGEPVWVWCTGCGNGIRKVQVEAGEATVYRAGEEETEFGYKVGDILCATHTRCEGKIAPPDTVYSDFIAVD